MITKKNENRTRIRPNGIVAITVAALLLSSCASGAKGADGGSSSAASTPAAQSEQTAENVQSVESQPTAESQQPAESGQTAQTSAYTFNPHLYVKTFSEDIPQEYWDSFYNLCDALRVGETTFACASEAAYRWATDPAVLNALFPAACTKIKGESNDGTTPFENGVGRIYYQMPVDEYVERQAQFEAMITDLLNSHLDSDDSEFEKVMKILKYMALNYLYQQDFVENKQDGANYVTLMTGEGQCIDLAGVYAYLLLQADVEAFQVGSSAPSLNHEWVYLVIDGQGYHSDVTWTLNQIEEEIPLYYALMTGERRTETGCAVDNLMTPVLPAYWISRTSIELKADDDTLSFPSASFGPVLDEEIKVVRYECMGEERELHYA